MAIASYPIKVPLGSVKNNSPPVVSTPAMINATPNGLTPAYCVNCCDMSAIFFATISTSTGSS